MTYKVNGNNRNYDILDPYNRPIGRLTYTTWFRAEAQVLTAIGVRYDLAPKGFLRRKIAVTREGAPFAELAYTWRGSMEITFTGGGSLLFKKRNFPDTTFVVLGSNDTEIAAIQSRFKWTSLAFDYSIEMHDNVLDTELNVLLPFISLYCVHSMRRRHAAH